MNETKDNLTLITRASRAGFFSDFFWALEGIKWADENNVDSVVHFGASDCLGPIVCSGMSGWSWSDFFLVDHESKPPPACSALARIGALAHPSGGDPPMLDALRQTFHSHSGFNSKTRRIIDDHVAFSTDRKALGVHFRAGDMRWAPDHPTPPSRKLMIRLILEEFAQDPSYSVVFVASRDKGFIRAARKALSGFAPLVTSPEVPALDEFPSRFALELGVLIDANNLARCSTIIHSPSNVASASQVIGEYKPHLRKEINLGTNPKRLPFSILKGLVLFEALARFREKRVEVMEYRIE